MSPGAPGARQLTHPGACSRNATCPQARSPSTLHSCELSLGNALAVSVELATFTRNLHHTLNCEEPVYRHSAVPQLLSVRGVTKQTRSGIDPSVGPLPLLRTAAMDPFQSRATRHREARRWWWLPSVLLFAIGLLAAFVIFLAAGRTGMYGAYFVPILTVAGIVIVVIVALRLLRRHGVEWAQPSPLSTLSRHERRLLIRAIRRNEPLPAKHQEIAKAAIRPIEQQHWMAIVSGTLVFGSNVFIALTLGLKAGSGWLNGALAVVAAGVLGLHVWMIRRVRRTSRSLGSLQEGADGQKSAS